jgi:class 3 adenylate cyclase
VLVSDTVRDIVARSTLAFADRGTYKLKGIEGERRLFAVM